MHPPFLICPSDNGSVAGNIWWKYVNQMQCDNISLSLRFVGLRVPPRFFRRGLQEAPVSTREVGRKNAATSESLCKQSVCIAFLCPFNVDEHRYEYDPLVKGFWILPVQIFPNLLLNPCPFRASSNFVAKLSDGSSYTM